MNDFIQQKLKAYTIASAHDEINALKEIAQEIILFGLSKTSFFNKVYFCGGTCLRIMHNLKRFSEDLDFSTLKADKNFNFDLYIKEVLDTLQHFGLDMHIVHKAKDDAFIKQRALKEDSQKWKISFPHSQPLKKITIK